jgi:hypothetical protein
MSRNNYHTTREAPLSSGERRGLTIRAMDVGSNSGFTKKKLDGRKNNKNNKDGANHT